MKTKHQVIDWFVFV